MATLTKVEKVFTSETNALLTPPFPVSLPDGGTVDLGKIVVPVGRDRDAFLIKAVVNWSATFTPPTPPTNSQLTVPGFVQITFELLRDGGPIFRVIEAAGQADLRPAELFTASTTSFVTTKLLHLDTNSLTGIVNPVTTFK